MIDYAIDDKNTIIPAYLRRTDVNDNFKSPSKSTSNSKGSPWSSGRKRPSSSTSEKKWRHVSTKVSKKRQNVLENKRRTHRIRSLTMRPPVTHQASLIPDDMRVSSKLPPLESNMKRLNLFLEQAEKRLVKGYVTTDVHDLLLEKQLLYSATFAELSRLVSTTGGDQAAEFLNRIWKLNQGLFESFVQLYDTNIQKSSQRVQEMSIRLADYKKERRNGLTSKLPSSLTGIVMAQLAKIREKRHDAQIAAHEAKIAALTNININPPPSSSSPSPPLQRIERIEKEIPSTTEYDDSNDITVIDNTERTSVQLLAYSGCADELERVSLEMLQKKESINNNQHNSDEQELTATKTTRIKKDPWVQIPGVMAAVDHFSAIVVVNMDLRTILTRGQRIKVGQTSMKIHLKKGKMSSLQLPVDQFWEGETQTGLKLYIKSSDSQGLHITTDSDMEEEENNGTGTNKQGDDEIDWVVIPATISVTKDDNLIVTSSDISSIVKRGTKIKVADIICTIAERGVFNYESFSTNEVWKQQSMHDIPLFVDATGVWGWDKAQDEVDSKNPIHQKGNMEDDNQWKKTGITCDITKDSKQVVTHEDSTCILLPGQIIKLGTHVINVGVLGSRFDTEGFALDRKWEHDSCTEMTIQVRKHEIQISIVRLHDALRCLGENPISGQKLNANIKTMETQTENGNFSSNSIEVSTQSDLSCCADEDLSQVIEEHQKLKGRKNSSELKAARKISLVARRKEKKGTIPMELTSVVHLWVQVCREKRKADSFANMLKQKHLSIPEYVLDFFVDRFGLLAIANEQLARFYLGLKKFSSSNSCARIACRSIGWIGNNETTHYMFRFSELALEVYHDLMVHLQSNIDVLAGQEKNKNEAADILNKTKITKDIDVYDQKQLTDGEKIRKSTSALVPRISVLAAWDVLRIRLKKYMSARRLFGVVTTKNKGKKTKRRGRWIDMTKNTFVSSSFKKIEEMAHVSNELQNKKSDLDAYVNLHVPGRREKGDVLKVTNLAVDLYTAVEIIVDTCALAFEKDQAKTSEAAKTLFHASDKDHDGVLTLVEFKALMRAAGARPSQHQLAQFYNDSVNAQGKISAESFAATVLHHIQVGDLKQIGNLNNRQIRRAAKQLEKKQKEDENQTATKGDEATENLEDKNIALGKEGENNQPEETKDAAEDTNEDEVEDAKTAGGAKRFICETCQRSFVREKGLIYHQTNECNAVTTDGSDVQGHDIDRTIVTAENLIIDEVESSDEEFITQPLPEEEDGNNGKVTYTRVDNDDEEEEDDEDIDVDTLNDKDNVHGDDYSSGVRISAAPINMELTARALLNKICTIMKEDDEHIDLSLIWGALAAGENYLGIEDFQAKVNEVAGFRPSDGATSSLWLLLDDDRNGWLEKHEFLNFAKKVERINKRDNVTNMDHLLLAGEEEIADVHLPTHIEASSLDGWDLLLTTWLSSEEKIRQTVIDFGGREEKIKLVLLDELCVEREDITSAWEAFQSLSAFLSRME